MLYKDYYDTYIDASKHTCPVCKKQLKWNGKSYNKYCSQSCANSITSKQNHIIYKESFVHGREKAKRTNLERYGNACSLHGALQQKKTKQTWKLKYDVEHPMQAECMKQTAKTTRYIKNDGEYFSKDSLNKFKSTCMNKYDVDNPFKSEEVKQKIKRTNLERYGVENVMQLELIRDKSTQTQIQRYGHVMNLSSTEYMKDWIQNYRDKTGYTHPSQNPDIIQSRSDKHYQRVFDFLQSKTTDKLNKIEGMSCICTCNVCKQQYQIDRHYFLQRVDDNVQLCTFCNPLPVTECHVSKSEQELLQFIKSVYSEQIIENDRTVLDGKELDIYLPDKKLAFEFDGIYWHNELFKENDYHLKKTELAEQFDIQLVHVFEDEWLHKQEIVKSRIKGLLNLNERIFARKCLVKQVNGKEAIDFLNQNHIQGAVTAKYKYGLYYNNELVSLMTFGKSRFKKDEFELLRFCNKLNINVVGGASRLFKHFEQDHSEIDSIISYADRRWSVGNLYEKLGFIRICKTEPNYFYVIADRRDNRIKYQKHKLIAEGFDPNKSEHEIMLDRKIYRIYDCGNLKYKYCMHK